MFSSRSDKQGVAAALRRQLAQAGYLRKRTSIHRAWDPAIAHLDLGRAAAVSGVDRRSLWVWVKGQTLPGHGPSDPGRFWAFIEKLGLDPRPFQGLIPASRQEKGRVRRICRDCGEVRWEQPGRLRLRLKHRRVEVDWERREARGLCRRCNSRRMMRESKSLTQAAYRNVQPKRWRIVLSEAKRGDPEARKKARKELGEIIRQGGPVPDRSTDQQRAAARAPRPKRSMQALLKGSRQRALGFCPLCGLLAEQGPEPVSWIRGTWHGACLNVWIDRSGQRRAQFAQRRPKLFLPPAPPKLGRPFKVEHLRRNLTAFLRHRADVLGQPGGCSIRRSAALAKINLRNLQRQIENVVRLLPGDWKLVYRMLTPVSYQSLQRLFQLPDRLRDLNETGRRDGLVRWLAHHHQMPVEQVSTITGMSVPQILALLKGRARASPRSGRLQAG